MTMKNSTAPRLARHALLAALALLILGLAAAAPARAQQNLPPGAVAYKGPLDWRRTLFAPFGQKMVMFEAPLGMCFLDETDPVEGMILREIRDAMRKKSRQSFVALFSDCLQIAAIGQDAPGYEIADVGIITWLNAAGETVPMPPEDYFSFREKTFFTYTQAGLASYLNPVVDETVRRTDRSATLGFTAELEVSYQKLKSVGVTAAMLIRGFPIDVTITHTAKEPRKDKEELYALMDKFVAQQIALNAVE